VYKSKETTVLELEHPHDDSALINVICFRSEFSTLPLFRGATLLVIEEGEETFSQWRSNVVEPTELSMPTGTAYSYVNSKPFCEQSLVEILHDVPFIMLMVSAVHPSRKKAIQKLESSINNNNDVLTFFVTWDQPTLSIPKLFPVESYNTCLFANSGQHAIELTRSIIEMITVPSLIGVDFADIKVTFSCKETLTATGCSGIGKGDNRALAAACNAIENMEKNGLFHSVFVCIHCSPDIELEEFTVICDEIEKELIDEGCIMIAVLYTILY
jgi:hypothetical protein